MQIGSETRADLCHGAIAESHIDSPEDRGTGYLSVQCQAGQQGNTPIHFFCDPDSTIHQPPETMVADLIAKGASAKTNLPRRSFIKLCEIGERDDAKIFGEMPLRCPNCGATMELAEFILDEIPIAKLFPDAARAPPRKQFDRYEAPVGELVYGHTDDEDADGAEFNQIPKDDDAIFNQENSW